MCTTWHDNNPIQEEKRMGHDPSQALVGLLAVWTVLAMIAGMFGGRRATHQVLAAPFRLGGWMLRGVLGALGHGVWAIISAIGRGIVQLLADIHRHLYGRWPGTTLLAYAILLLVAGLYIRSR